MASLDCQGLWEGKHRQTQPRRRLLKQLLLCVHLGCVRLLIIVLHILTIPRRLRRTNGARSDARIGDDVERQR